MLNAVYRLVAPRRFEVEFGEVPLFGQEVIVRPTHLSICHADQRYYQGSRPAEVLKQKLPMALIHEGIGKVVHDPTGQFSYGQTVIMIPNTPTEHDDIIAENYLRSSKFRASGFDGFMQEYVSLQPDRLVVLPEGLLVDHAFECVGGAASQSAIDQIIDHIQPEGTIGLLGVSEYPVPINTRMVLEKGLRLYGSSRSGRSDFVKTVELYQSHPEIVNYLDAIVGARIEVRSMADMVRAFEMDIHKSMGKTIMHWMQ